MAKQATSYLDMVHIQVGDAADMAFDDVVLSFFVTCNLPPNGFILLNALKSFIEYCMVPGGKVIPTDWSHSSSPKDSTLENRQEKKDHSNPDYVKHPTALVYHVSKRLYEFLKYLFSYSYID